MLAAFALQAVSVGVPTLPPAALPGDHPPLPLAVMLAPPHAGSPPPPDRTPGPSIDVAVAAARAAVAHCRVRGVRVRVAVVDVHGGLRAALATDGATPDHLFIAARKAAAATAFGMPTSQVQARLRSDPEASARLKPYMAVTSGAVPLRIDGHPIGAIGASGGSGTEDEECAAAGAAAAMRMRGKPR